MARVVDHVVTRSGVRTPVAEDGPAARVGIASVPAAEMVGLVVRSPVGMIVRAAAPVATRPATVEGDPA